MSLLGQQQSLDTLLGLKTRLAIKQGLLLKEQRLLEAELATLEELLQKKRYQESILMQSHLAIHAIDRLNGLSERVAQSTLTTTNGEIFLNEEFAKADRRFNARMLLVEGSLFRQDDQSLGFLRATRILDSRKEFIHALYQHERQEAILKWAGETPEAIQQWKEEERPHIDAHAENDPHRDVIFTAADIPEIDDKDLKAAKARYLALLTEVTALVDQVRQLESLSSDTEAERRQVERQAKAESQMLGRIYATNLFNGKSELAAYQLTSESLAAACEMHSKRLEATHENALALKRRQIEELLAENNRAIDPNSANGFRGRADKALADRSVDALAQIRRELAELFELAEQAKSGPATAKFFETRGHSSTAVINGAAAFAKGAPGGAAASSEAYKAIEIAREWEESAQLNAHRDGGEQEQIKHTKI
jgi:hypothetical protein